MALTTKHPGLFDQVAIRWFELKTGFEQGLPFHNDALHVIAGVAIQLLAALVLRRGISRPGPWLVVAILTLLNEWSDLRAEHWPDLSDQWFESGKDVALTLVLPTLLLLVARLRPKLLR